MSEDFDPITITAPMLRQVVQTLMNQWKPCTSRPALRPPKSSACGMKSRGSRARSSNLANFGEVIVDS
jgi:hypothetical protein